MSIAAFVTMSVIGAIAAQAQVGKTVQATERTIVVCLQGSNIFGFKSAQATATEMFAQIGVKVEWRKGLAGCPPQGIQVSLTDRTPEDLRPKAFAFATPGEGRARIFYDRIRRVKPRLPVEIGKEMLIPHLLAHVLVHEITHCLQGISRHSDRGVMKAGWDPEDFTSMFWGELPFTSEDVTLIHAGLMKRASQSVAGGEMGVRVPVGLQSVEIAAK
jgi:hypothetical protein